MCEKVVFHILCLLYEIIGGQQTILSDFPAQKEIILSNQIWLLIALKYSNKSFIRINMCRELDYS